jgi:hypothetical protein
MVAATTSFRRLVLWGLFALSGVAGCGQSSSSSNSDSDPGGGTSGTASTATGGGSGRATGGVAGSATGGVQSGGTGGMSGSGGSAGEPVQGQCRAPTPCPELQILTGEANSVPTKEDIICVLEALRDGTHGRYVVGTQVLSGGPNGVTSTGSMSQVHGERKVRVVYYGSTALTASECELYPSEHYDECIARLEADAGVGGGGGVYDCSWQTNCVDGSPMCPSD